MKILVITQYFWPENFRINDLCQKLHAEGHEVFVLTGKPNYPNGKFYNGYSCYNKNVEFWNGIKIYRTPIIPRGKGDGFSLFVNYLSYALSSTIRLFTLKEKYDKIFVYQLSPATIILPSIVSKIVFKIPLYFYIQDLWPESIADAGGINAKYILNIFDYLMLKFYERVDVILVQSNGFKNHIANKGVDKNKIIYLPNTVEDFYKPAQYDEEISKLFPQGFNILFAGNVGVAQDFNTIIKAAIILENKKIPINWLILGDGRDKEKTLQNININNLNHRFYFLGAYPSCKMPYFFNCADLLLVSLKSSIIFSLTIPSKLQSYMACSRPIIANVEGVTFDIINVSKSGLASKSNDYESLAKNVEKFYLMEESELEVYSKNAYNYFMKEFDRNVVYNKLLKILSDDAI